MNYLVIEIIIWAALAAVIGFLAGWLIRIWPFWKRFKEYEKEFESYHRDTDKKINQIELDLNDKLKTFQLNYEDRMRKFQTEYEEGLNNFQNDYADGFSAINKESKILVKEMAAFRKDMEHKFSEYSSKYFYLENKFNTGFINKEYEAAFKELADRIDAVDKRVVTHKHTEKAAAKTKSSSKAKPKTAGGAKAKISTNIKDDLKQIIGIGRVMESALFKQGVKTYKELASLRKTDIENLSKKLKGFGDKLKKEKWIQQAKALMKRK